MDTSQIPSIRLPDPGLCINVKISTNSRYGSSSTAHILTYALIAYRDIQFREMIKSLKSGENESAYDSYQDYRKSIALLDEVTLELSLLAEANNWKADSKDPMSPDYSGNDRYRDFLLEFTNAIVDYPTGGVNQNPA